ncbi:MAG TPA: FtsX-like permease family protein [Candidatus Saccharimonadales bacterium]|nr:FtsX-like permease family protein [Candidatus Saccharimonadales bacterium]
MAFKNIIRRPGRATLTIIALAVSVSIVVALSAISLGTAASVHNTLYTGDALQSIVVSAHRETNGQSLFGTTQEVNPNAPKLDDALRAQLQTIPNVRSASPVAAIWEFKSFTVPGFTKTFTAQAQGVLPTDARAQHLSAGTPFLSNDQRHVVIIGQAYAKALGFEGSPGSLVGKTMTITTQNGYQGEGASLPGNNATESQLQQFATTPTQLTATIIGVGIAGQDENTLFIPMDWAHQVRTLRRADPPKDQIYADGYSSIIVQVANAAQLQQTVAAIQAHNVGAAPLLAQFQQLLSFSLIVWLTLAAVSLVALIAASLGIVNTMLMVVSEQRYLIGVWRACGATKSHIRGLFLTQAIILGIIGGCLGSALGVGAAYLFNQQVSSLLASQQLPIQVIAVVPWWLLLATLGATVLFAVLSGSYPAIRAARQDPTVALSSN